MQAIWQKTTRVLGAILFAIAAFMASEARAQGISLIRDAEIEQALRDYTDPILVAAELNPADIKIYIVNDPTLNAFVAEGQNIFVHTGLIVAADTPSQLKGVIAHETGHIAGGHLARSREAQGAAYVPVLASIALGILAIAAGAPDAGIALISGAQAFGLASLSRFTQVQESAADQAGATFLETSGQTSEGLVDFFAKFRYLEVVSESRAPPYFKTHPLSADRIEALRTRLAKSPFKDVKDSPADLQRFALLKAKLEGYLDPPGRVFARYPKSNDSLEAHYARAVAAYRIPDLGVASQELRYLMARQPENPYYPELMGQLLFEHQRAEEAVFFNRRAVALKSDSALLDIALARALNADGPQSNPDEAVVMLNKAIVLEPDNAYAWSELASIHDARGEGGMARLATAEAYFAIGGYQQAFGFAERAKRELTEGSVSWRRASDISQLAQAEVRQGQGG